MRGHAEKTAICRPGGEPLPGTLTLDVQPPDCENKCLSFKLPSLFVTAARADSCNRCFK